MISLEKLSGESSPEDIEFCRRIRNTNSRFFLFSGHISREEHEEWFNAVINEPNISFYIIKVGNKNAGTISLYEEGKGLYEIHNVNLDKKYWGTGLLKKATDMLMEKGKTYKIQAQLNNPRAVSAYQKLGFTPKSITLWKSC